VSLPGRSETEVELPLLVMPSQEKDNEAKRRIMHGMVGKIDVIGILKANILFNGKVLRR
jgi:hypothetical protein